MLMHVKSFGNYISSAILLLVSFYATENQRLIHFFIYFSARMEVSQRSAHLTKKN